MLFLFDGIYCCCFPRLNCVSYLCRMTIKILKILKIEYNRRFWFSKQPENLLKERCTALKFGQELRLETIRIKRRFYMREKDKKLTWSLFSDVTRTVMYKAACYKGVRLLIHISSSYIFHLDCGPYNCLWQVYFAVVCLTWRSQKFCHVGCYWHRRQPCVQNFPSYIFK